mmetsp:Transcript_5655/g.19160  ORF Transcript_5655/g.19160 Transcript_5655/m.19160 type:complete len:298 (-) Transcript_5655:448-1341(-)
MRAAGHQARARAGPEREREEDRRLLGPCEEAARGLYLHAHAQDVRQGQHPAAHHREHPQELHRQPGLHARQRGQGVERGGGAVQVGVRHGPVRPRGQDRGAQAARAGGGGGQLQHGDGRAQGEAGGAAGAPGQARGHGKATEREHGEEGEPRERGGDLHAEAGARGEAHHRPGGGEGALEPDRGGARGALHQPHGRHDHLRRHAQLPRGLHHVLPGARGQGVGAGVQEDGHPQQRGVLAHHGAGGSREDPRVDHRGPPERPFLHRQRHHGGERAPLAAHDRPAGAGEQVGEEHGEGA